MSPGVSVVLSDGCSVASALCHRLRSTGRGGGRGGASQVRSSPVLDSWYGLTDVCKGADIVYLLSALDLPDLPNEAHLREFRTGVSRVLECCQECGVGCLVFVSSSKVVSGKRGLDFADENVPFVTSQEDRRAHAIAVAEAEVLKASETQNLGGSSCLYTCALRPAIIHGTGQDRYLHRALSWVGWGLNRVALGPKNIQSDMVHSDNLIEAQVLAGAKLMEGAADAQAGGAGWSTHAPVCSGRAYFVTDGQPCNPQAFMDGVLDGLDFSTSKVLRVPTVVALATAGIAELACKAGLTGTPVWTRAEVRKLTEGRTLSIARIRKDLGYEPIVDPGTALRSTVAALRETGWGRHTFMVPGLGYWMCIPLGIWLTIIAAFEGACPALLAPVQRGSLYLHLAVFRRFWAVRTLCIAVILIHVAEGLYVFRLAQRVGHKDTAPLWLIQTTILGFPSTLLARQLML